MNWITSETRRNIIFFGVLIVLIVILLSFNSIFIHSEKRSIFHFDYDMGLLSGDPCSMPCWQGITPGKTSSKEALTIVQNSPYVMDGSIEIGFDMNNGGCTWNWKQRGKFTNPGMSWTNGIVNEIIIGLTFDFSVGNAIDQFGPPEMINVTPGGIPEAWYWIVTMYYPSKGFDFVALTDEGDNYLDESTPIGGIDLYEQKSLQLRALEKGYPQQSIDLLGQKSSLMLWNGYGDVLEIYNAQPD